MTKEELAQERELIREQQAIWWSIWTVVRILLLIGAGEMLAAASRDWAVHYRLAESVTSTPAMFAAWPWPPIICVGSLAVMLAMILSLAFHAGNDNTSWPG